MRPSRPRWARSPSKGTSVIRRHVDHHQGYGRERKARPHLCLRQHFDPPARRSDASAPRRTYECLALEAISKEMKKAVLARAHEALQTDVATGV